MKIIALADTHSQELPKALLDDIKSADLIVHVGDFCELGVYEQLKGMRDVRAVYGNMDGVDLRERLPKHLVIECEGVKIGLAHGEGNPEGILPKLQALFKDKDVHAVIFGHSHQPFQENIGGILYFNPGSPTDTVRPPYRSYGVIEVKSGKIKAHIVKLK